MSASNAATAALATPHVDHDESKLAPMFRAAVDAAIAECHSAGLDAVVYECCRSDALAELYHKRGVSRAPNARFTWHGYGLAVDVISKTKEWDVAESWWRAVAEIFKRHGCSWGGEWKSFKDTPHMQFGNCPSSPTAADRELYYAGGMQAVWKKYGAE